MSRTYKNRKCLPEYVQHMWKDSGHQGRKNAFLAVDSSEYDGESAWSYRPLSRHTALRIHSTSSWDDVLTSFYADKINWKYNLKKKIVDSPVRTC